MVLFNYSTREVTTKVVYYGPGLCGKTTNLRFIYDSLPTDSKSKMLSLATNQDRTLFFDFLPLDLGTIRGMRVRLQLYTVPGQVYYNSTRQLVLKGADGVIFVADSQDFALEANLESWRDLKENLKGMNLALKDFPHVIQYNKRDLPSASPVEELSARLNEYGAPGFEGIATTGYSVEATLKALTHLVLKRMAVLYGLPVGEDISEREIILFPTDEAARSRKTAGRGADEKGKNMVWEKEVRTTERSALDGEELELGEVAPARVERPSREVGAPVVRPAGTPDRPSGSIRASGTIQIPHAAVPQQRSSSPVERTSSTFEAAASAAPQPFDPPAVIYGGLELDPVPMPEPGRSQAGGPDAQHAPLTPEKVERQMAAGRSAQSPDKAAQAPATASSPASGAREVVIPVTLSRNAFELAMKGGLVIKLKFRIEP